MGQAKKRELSLKGLELFQICASKRSLQEAAAETGLSVSTISHHLHALEDYLGVALFDHQRRPMMLTPKGRVFLLGIDDAMQGLRRATAEAVSGDIANARQLRLGSIEDFDSDVVPELAGQLSLHMPECEFQILTDSSHAIIDMLRRRELDIGITASPPERLKDLTDLPLLRDPYVVVLPASWTGTPEEVVEGRADMPFLRFSSNLLMAKQIESQLTRLRVTPPMGFACSNSQTLMAMVASGAGWTITTPLLFARARRFQQELRMCPFPGKQFARTLSIVATPDCAHSVVDLLDARFRSLAFARVVQPLWKAEPWLRDSFQIID
ncbi:MAG: LysR family transcriptional regulator [Pseudomonadota bacterium]